MTKVAPNLDFLMTQLETNKSEWNRLFAEYEEKMNQGNYYMSSIIEERKLPGASVFDKRKTLDTVAKLPPLLKTASTN